MRTNKDIAIEGYGTVPKGTRLGIIRWRGDKGDDKWEVLPNSSSYSIIIDQQDIDYEELIEPTCDYKGHHSQSGLNKNTKGEYIHVDEFNEIVANSNPEMNEGQLTQHMIDLDPEEYGYELVEVYRKIR